MNRELRSGAEAERRTAPHVPRPYGRRADDRVQLTARQKRILGFVIHGLENKDIGRRLGISEQAVKQQVSVLLRKFSVPSRAALTEAAVTTKLLGSQAAASDVPLEYLFDRAPVLIVVTRGPEHRFILANPAYRAFVGVNDCIGRTVAECLPLAYPDQISELDETYRTGVPYRNPERPYTRTAGGRTPDDGWLSLIREPTRAPDGTVDGIALYAWDVTDHVRLRRQLQQLSAEREILLEQLPFGVIYTDVEARPRLVNAVARRILGTVDPSRSLWAQGEEWHVRYAVDQRPLVATEFPSARATSGRPFDHELIIRRADGVDVLLRVSARALHDEHGSVTGAAIAFFEGERVRS